MGQRGWVAVDYERHDAEPGAQGHLGRAAAKVQGFSRRGARAFGENEDRFAPCAGSAAGLDQLSRIVVVAGDVAAQARKGEKQRVLEQG